MRLAFDRVQFGRVDSFSGKWIFISTACTFLVKNADRALLGKFISLELLGIYSMRLLPGQTRRFCWRRPMVK